MTSGWRPHFYLFLANLIYGLNYSIAKEAMLLPVPPTVFVLLRVSGAFLLFMLAGLIIKKEGIEKRDVVRLIICAFFGVALNQVLFFEGLHRTSPIHAGIIMVLTPVLVLLFTWIILKEKLRLIKIGGVLLGLAGALLLVVKGNSGNGESSLSGDVMVLINAASYAVYLVLVKPLMNKYQPLTVMKTVFLIGLPMVLIASFHQWEDTSFAQIPVDGWLAIGYIIVFTTFLAYLLNVMAMKKVSPSIAGIYIYLQPVLAAFFASLLGQDELQGIHLVSSLLIFAGVYMVSRPVR